MPRLTGGLLASSLAACLGLAIAPPQADAAVLLGVTNTNFILFGTAPSVIDWNGAGRSGGEVLTFRTTAANTRVVIMFNAECGVDGDIGKSLKVRIAVTPAGGTQTIVSPTNSDNVFCSGDGVADGIARGLVSAAIIAPLVLPQAGDHKVQVNVDGGAAGIATLDDMSLVVMN
jgi:hypothetical protein